MPTLRTWRRKDSCPKAHFAVFSQQVDSYNDGHLVSNQPREPERDVFLGKFARTLDERNRITVPATYKAALTSGAYITQGFDRNLQVLTASAFAQVYRQAASLNTADPLARLLLRLFLGSAVEVQQPRGGIAIPDSLKEFAGLKDNVLLIGQGDYFEIWSPEQWGRQEAELRNVEANASRFAGLTLGVKASASI